MPRQKLKGRNCIQENAMRKQDLNSKHQAIKQSNIQLTELTHHTSGGEKHRSQNKMH
jgi:hypothetical protein